MYHYLLLFAIIVIIAVIVIISITVIICTYWSLFAIMIHYTIRSHYIEFDTYLTLLQLYAIIVIIFFGQHLLWFCHQVKLWFASDLMETGV